LLRLPARHGGPGGRGEARAEVSRAGRDVAPGRALRERRRRGEPEPGRPPVLLGLDARLHAGLALAGGWARARRSGGRGAAPWRARGGGLHACTACDGHALQPGDRGPAVTTGGPATAGSSTAPGGSLWTHPREV